MQNANPSISAFHALSTAVSTSDWMNVSTVSEDGWLLALSDTIEQYQTPPRPER